MTDSDAGREHDVHAQMQGWKCTRTACPK